MLTGKYVRLIIKCSTAAVEAQEVLSNWIDLVKGQTHHTKRIMHFTVALKSQTNEGILLESELVSTSLFLSLPRSFPLGDEKCEFSILDAMRSIAKSLWSFMGFALSILFALFQSNSSHINPALVHVYFSTSLLSPCTVWLFVVPVRFYGKFLGCAWTQLQMDRIEFAEYHRCAEQTMIRYLDYFDLHI